MNCCNFDAPAEVAAPDMTAMWFLWKASRNETRSEFYYSDGD